MTNTEVKTILEDHLKFLSSCELSMKMSELPDLTAAIIGIAKFITLLNEEL